MHDSQLGRTHGGNWKEPRLGFIQPDSQSHLKPSKSVGERWHVPFPQYTISHRLKISAQTQQNFHNQS